jgi:hypothetical protein
VPVLLSDEVELPFQNVIDYTEISIKWPSSKIGPELFQYLESIPGMLPFSLLPPLLSLVPMSIKVMEYSCRGKSQRDDCSWS